MSSKKITVSLETTEVQTDPKIDVHTITVDRNPEEGSNEKGGTWPETYGSLSEIKAYLKGLKVAFAMMGHHDIVLPPVPEK